MKQIYISLNELDSSLPRIWEMCEEHGLDALMTPYNGQIAILKEKEKIAEIQVIKITDYYDIADFILNK